MSRVKRVYDETEREAALTIVVERGLADAVRETGIPKSTIEGWVQSRGIRTVRPAKMAEARAAAEDRIVTLRAALRLSFLEKIHDLLARMDAPHIDFKGKDANAVTYPIAPAAAVQNYATSVGILLDKFRLESGEATGRTESRSLSDVMPDHEKEALADAIDSWIKDREHVDA